MDLEGNMLGDKSIKNILKAVQDKGNQQLRSLNLSKNNITWRCGKLLG